MRKADWPTKLAEALNEAKNKPFAWGSHDCVLFAADVVKAITGKDYAAEHRGTYNSARGAYQFLQKHSPDKAASGLVDQFFDRIPVKFAGRGDVLAIQTKHGPALGICAGMFGFFVLDTGLVRYPLNICSLAWRVV